MCGYGGEVSTGGVGMRGGGGDEDGPLLFTMRMAGILRFFRAMQGGNRSVKIHGIKYEYMGIVCL